MLSEEDAVRLHHMLEAAREAVGYAKDRTREGARGQAPWVGGHDREEGYNRRDFA